MSEKPPTKGPDQTDLKMPPPSTGRVGDLPRDEIQSLANQVLSSSKGKPTIYFKFTCASCGQRCTLAEPNTLHEIGECFACGKETEIENAGFMVVYELPKVEKRPA